MNGDNNKVTLGYWAIRGLAQRIRMLLEYTSTPYQEIKYTADNNQWFGVDKPELLKKNPVINLPYLIDGDKVVAETEAILIHIVHRSGKPELLGRNAQEQVDLAVANGVNRDLHSKYIQLVYGRYGDKPWEEAKAEHLELFKPFLVKLNALLEGREYYAGGITWIDFAIAEFENCLWLLEAGLVESYPNVQAHWKRVWELPSLQAYHASVRWSERPINNPKAAKFY